MVKVVMHNITIICIDLYSHTAMLLCADETLLSLNSEIVEENDFSDAAYNFAYSLVMYRV